MYFFFILDFLYSYRTVIQFKDKIQTERRSCFKVEVSIIRELQMKSRNSLLYKLTALLKYIEIFSGTILILF